jgi:hypothetical protein
MRTTNVTISSWVQRVRAEYLEMPGLNLTRKQIQRLWSLDEADCDAVLEVLIARRFLKPMKGNVYVRADGRV